MTSGTERAALSFLDSLSPNSTSDVVRAIQSRLKSRSVLMYSLCTWNEALPILFFWFGLRANGLGAG